MSPRALRSLCLLLATLACAPALAQMGELLPGGESLRDWRADLAASDERLWLGLTRVKSDPADSDTINSLLYTRTTTEPFALPRSLHRTLTDLAALRDGALLVFTDGALYSAPLGDGSLSVQVELPEKAVPLDLEGVGYSGAFAIVSSEIALQLDETFAAADAPLSLVKLDQRRWQAVAPLPPAVQSSAERRLRPRLCYARETLLLVANTDAGLASFRWDETAAAWVAVGVVDAGDVLAFWTVTVSNTPTLIAATAAEEGPAEQLRGWRLLGNPAEPTGAQWKAGELQLSTLPGEIVPQRVASAVGFNQHIVLLVEDQNQDRWFRYARVGDAPGEESVNLEALLAPPMARQRTMQLFHALTLMVLVTVMVLLFVFRRHSMVTPVDLPAHTALALTSQRLLGFLIDFVPFSLFAAYVHDLNWMDGMRAMFGWLFVTGAEDGLPEEQFISWWLVSLLGYVTYATIVELIMNRTLGKLLTRTQVISERSERPGRMQIALRNLARFIELLPPLWLLSALVILSRNRQRLGDILARTVVIRRAPLDPQFIEQMRRAEQKRRRLAERDAESEQHSESPEQREPQEQREPADTEPPDEPRRAAHDENTSNAERNEPHGASESASRQRPPRVDTPDDDASAPADAPQSRASDSDAGVQERDRDADGDRRDRS